MASALACMPAIAQQEVPALHAWNRIDYPSQRARWGMDGMAPLSLRPAAAGLRRYVPFTTDDETAPLPKNGDLLARMHRSPSGTDFVDLRTPEDRAAVGSFTTPTLGE